MAQGLVKRLQGYFRGKRNRLLTDIISEISARTGRPVSILDVGGRAEFWDSVACDAIGHVTITNIAEGDITFARARYPSVGLYGNILDLSAFRDQGFDLVVCNSVIEHLVTWANIRVAARELLSVAPRGFIQTPSFWFPVEQHFMIPVFHWLAPQIRVKLLPYLPRRGYRDVASVDAIRDYIEEINLLTFAEMKFLFPGKSITRERFLGLTKSYVVHW